MRIRKHWGMTLRGVMLVGGMVGSLAGCREATPPSPVSHVVVATLAALPVSPDDPVWEAAREFRAPLIAQDQVEPRLLDLSTAEVRVRAISDGQRLAFRLQWSDATRNDKVDVDAFADACAVQLPRLITATVPAPQMGERGQAVDIVMWSAAWQADVDGRGDSIRDLHPHASVDHYPFESPVLEPDSAPRREMENRYAPARALGNTMAGPRDTPVQDLVAEGPGSLTPVTPTESSGAGLHTADGWAVVVARPLPANLLAQGGTQVAFAVWDGGQREVGARKMRTVWIPLTVETQP